MENLCTSGVDRWKRADELEDFRDSTEVTGFVNYKRISGPQAARHLILHHSQQILRRTRWMECKFYAHNAVPVSLQIYLQTRGLPVL